MSIVDYINAQNDHLRCQNDYLNAKNDCLKLLNEINVKDKEISHFQLERISYLKAAVRMYQRGIVELELQAFLEKHTNRNPKNTQFYCGSSTGHNCDFSS